MEYKVVTIQYGISRVEGNTYEDEKGWKYRVGFEYHKRVRTGMFTIYCRKPGKVRITFGKPIIIDDLAKEERRFLSGYTQNIIKEMLDAHKCEN